MQQPNQTLLSKIEEGKTDPILFAREILGLDLNVVQETWFTETVKKGRKRCILVPSNQVGKLNPLTEPVLTPKGFIPMGDVRVGETVYADTGEPAQVLQVYPQGKQPIYRFHFDDESWSDCGLDHLWKVMTPTNRFSKNFNDYPRDKKKKRLTHKEKVKYKNEAYNTWSVIDTREIIKRWGMNPRPGNRVSIPVTEPVQFPDKEVPIDPYVLGALIGDGGLSTSTVKITSVDEDILESIRKAGFDVVQQGKPIDYVVKGIKPFIAQVGLLGKRSWEKHIPKQYLINSTEKRLALLQGLMDTDGSVMKNGAMEYTTVSKQLAEDVKFLVQSFGGKVVTRERYTTYTYKGEKKTGRKSYRLRIRIRENPFRLKRKSKRFVIVTKYRDHRVLQRIERVKDAEAQCIMVDHPTHTYLTRDFIVTHNTLGEAVLHIWHGFYKPKVNGTEEQRLKAQYPTLNISPVSHQMRAMFDYVKQIMNGDLLWTDPETGEPKTNDCKIKWFMKKVVENPMPTIYWANGATFHGRSVHDDKGKGLAGGQYAFISYDECPISNHLRDELAGNIISRLIKYNGDLHLIGTPNSESPSNPYYMHIVKKGLEQKEGWYALRGKLDDNKFFTEKDRREIKQNLLETNPDQYRQVVFGDFVDAGSGYFTPEQVNNLFKDDIEYEDPKPGRRYVLSCDWAVSKGDYSVYITIDFTDIPYRVVNIRRFQGNEFTPEEQFGIVRDLQEKYGSEVVSDAGGLGGAIISEYLHDIITQSMKFGGLGDLKKEMLLALKDFMSKGELISPYNPDLEEELGTYKEQDKRLTQDMVMALAMASWYIRENYVDSEKGDLIEINLFK